MTTVDEAISTDNHKDNVNNLKNNEPTKVVEKRRTGSYSLSYFDEDEEDKNQANGNKNKKDDDPNDIHTHLLQLQHQLKINNNNKPTSPPTSPPPAEIQLKEEDNKEDATPENKEEKEEEIKENDKTEKREKKVAEDLKGLFTLDSFFVLKDMALDGNLDLTGLRGITWRVLLGVLSADTSLWADQTQKHRTKFTKLKDKYIIDPHKAAANSEADKFNPLSQHEENPWNQYFQDAELQKEITHDVLRTYQGNPFFDKESTKQTMTQLLFLYAKEHSSTRYIQGMNELLAPILLVLHDEASPITDSPTIFDIVSSAAYVEADAYTLFSHLLLIVGRWFSPLKSGNSPPISLSKKDALLDDKLYFGGQADESTNLQIVQQCRHIHYDLLNEVDPHLSRYLRDLQIEPHLYMLRWVRIVLTQVFALPDVLIIWDGIFSFGLNAVLLDWMCVAMLVTIRHSLLGQDYSSCMQLLFNYPQNQDVRVLVGTARSLFKKFQTQRQISPPKTSSPSPSTTNKQPTTNTITQKTHAQAQAQSPATQAQQNATRAQSPPASSAQNARGSQGVMKERAPTPPNAPQFPQVVQEPLARPGTPNSNANSNANKQKSLLQFIFSEGESAGTAIANEETQHLRNVSAHMANRLERVLFLLSSLSTPENDETIKSVTEEVNQIKTTLLEVSEFKLKSSSSIHNNNESSSEPRQEPLVTITTNHNNNSQIPSINNNNVVNSSSPEQSSVLYEKILSIDPLNIFRRK